MVPGMPRRASRRLVINSVMRNKKFHSASGGDLSEMPNSCIPLKTCWERNTGRNGDYGTREKNDRAVARTTHGAGRDRLRGREIREKGNNNFAPTIDFAAE